MKRHIPNAITGCRILFSIIMVFCSGFSYPFYITYILCGVSDMVDGTIARKMNADSEFGAKLDGVADCIFVLASFVKLSPMLCIPIWLWVWMLIIAAIKNSNIIFGFVFHKKLIFMHTVMNKVTGLMLFLLPLTIPFVDFRYSSIAVCMLATISGIWECVIIQRGNPKLTKSYR